MELNHKRSFEGVSCSGFAEKMLQLQEKEDNVREEVKKLQPQIDAVQLKQQQRAEELQILSEIDLSAKLFFSSEHLDADVDRETILLGRRHKLCVHRDI